MTYRQVADHVKQRQRLRHRDMREPADDWYPEAWFLIGGVLRREAIPVALLANRRTKAQLWQALATVVRAAQARVVALSLVMYWLPESHPMGRLISERQAAGEESPTAGLPYFQDVEGSIELLCVHVFDAERHELWRAAITRPEAGPPALAPFELVGPDAMLGDMIDPIKAALR